MGKIKGENKIKTCDHCGKIYSNGRQANYHSTKKCSPIKRSNTMERAEKINIELDNETKVIAFLSGYIRELKEGKDYEQTTYSVAKMIDNLYESTPQVREETKWISVESPPKGKTDVLIADKASINGVDTAWYDKDFEKWWYNDSYDDCQPTHWQHLPSPPSKEVNTKE